MAVTILDMAGFTLVIIGSFFALSGAIGIIRFPDFFNRIHAATVTIIGGSSTLLTGLALLALQMNYMISIKVLTIAMLIIVLTPISSHALVRAAYKNKEPLWKDTICDKLKEDGQEVARDRT